MRWVNGEPSVENYRYCRSSAEDHTLDSNTTLCPLDNGGHTSPAQVGLRGFDKLPQEILEMVFAEILDIQSLTKFRRVNRRALQTVDSVHAYRQIVTRFPMALRAILSIRTGATYSCQDLYLELQTAECRTCGRFGGFLYLLTCKRVCAVCFSSKNIYVPIQKCDVLGARGLYPQDLANLPSMRTISGYFTKNNIHSKERLILYDLKTVTDRGLDRYGSLCAVGNRGNNVVWAGLLSRVGEQAYRDRRNMESRRFMAVIRAPVFKGSNLEWGVHCKECRGRFEAEHGKSQYGALVFDPESFPQHVEKHQDEDYDESLQLGPTELAIMKAYFCNTLMFIDRIT
ncbi:hypothetical protein BJX64DRAFT_291847 [Aspergillus heterothallicus]